MRPEPLRKHVRQTASDNVDEHRGRFGVEPMGRVLDASASADHQRTSGERSLRPWTTSGYSRASAPSMPPTTTPTASGF
jgi:hypothetical protein